MFIEKIDSQITKLIRREEKRQERRPVANDRV